MSSSFASVQILTVALYRSSSVISPSRYCSSSCSTDTSALVTISFFLEDTLTSFIAIDTPERDEFLKPSSLILSKTAAVFSFPSNRKQTPVKSFNLFLSTSSFTNAIPSGRTSLNNILPTVVSIQSPLLFLTEINALKSTAPTS